MTTRFADTSYWIALLNTDDEWHEAALVAGRQHRGLIITTQWVLTEVMDGYSSRSNRSEVAAFIRTLERQANISVIPATEDWFHRGLELYEQRPDKEWSLTDCISFLVMRDWNLSDALTGDHHFEQAGFTALLK